MKKSIFSIMAVSAILLGLSSCGKDKVELGTVTLDPVAKTVTYGQMYTIKPTFSTAGEAKGKSYKWMTSDSEVAVVETVLGSNNGKVTAKRVGEAIISFESTDGKIKKISKVVVSPRTNLFNGLYYVNGTTSVTQLKNSMSTVYEYDESTSDANNVVFNHKYADDDKTQITKLIYTLENNKIKYLNVILKNTSENKAEAVNYMEERFSNTGITKEGITYFLNKSYVSTSSSIPVNTAMGLFLNKSVAGTDYPLGIRITEYDNVK